MKLLTSFLLSTLLFTGWSAMACDEQDLGNGQYLRQSHTGNAQGAWRFARCFCDAGDQLVAGGCDITPSRSNNKIIGTFTSSIPVVNGTSLGWLCQLNYTDAFGGGDEVMLTRVICKK